jgi:peptidoglycan-associated lipoprotein
MTTRPLCLSLVLLSCLLVGCHKAKPVTAPYKTPAPATAPVPPPAPPARPAAAPIRPAATPLTEDELFRRKSLDELNSEHPLNDAFFSYDQSTLTDTAQQALQRDAQWLQRWPQTVIRIDGHCDERGTPEYNMALGSRRATTVKDYLTNLGIRDDRIQIRSLGKEAPFCSGDDESCWSQNRRGHFTITSK